MSQWLCWWISGVTRNHRPGSRLAQQKGLPALAKRPVEAEAPNNSADWTHHSPPAFPLPLLLLLVFPPTKIGSRLLHTTRFRGSKNHERWAVEAWLCRWFQGLEIAGAACICAWFCMSSGMLPPQRCHQQRVDLYGLLILKLVSHSSWRRGAVKTWPHAIHLLPKAQTDSWLQIHAISSKYIHVIHVFFV